MLESVYNTVSVARILLVVSLDLVSQGADTNITMDHFSGLAKGLKQYRVNHEMISYGGAPHAFTVFRSSRYRENTDKKSWKRFTGFLANSLAK